MSKEFEPNKTARINIGGYSIPWTVWLAIIAVISNAAIAQYRINELEKAREVHEEQTGHTELRLQVERLKARIGYLEQRVN